MRDWGESSQQKTSEIKQSIERIGSEHGANIRPNVPPTKQPSIFFEKGTTIKKIAGYDCEQYLVEGRSGQVYEDWWVAPVLASPPYFEMLKIASVIDPARVRVVDEMKDSGVQLGLIVRMPAGAVDKSWEAYEVNKGPIDPSLFRVSDSYDKIESPFVKFKLGIGRK